MKRYRFLVLAILAVAIVPACASPHATPTPVLSPTLRAVDPTATPLPAPTPTVTQSVPQSAPTPTPARSADAPPIDLAVGRDGAPDWPMFRFSLDRAGYNPHEKTVKPPLELKWQFKAKGKI